LFKSPKRRSNRVSSLVNPTCISCRNSAMSARSWSKSPCVATSRSRDQVLEEIAALRGLEDQAALLQEAEAELADLNGRLQEAQSGRARAEARCRELMRDGRTPHAHARRDRLGAGRVSCQADWQYVCRAIRSALQPKLEPPRDD